MRNKNTRKGFTTVELVIVIAVIAILATVLIPTFSNMIEKANLSVDTQTVRNMNVCLQTYIMADDPMAFGTVQKRLEEYGYSREDSFEPKTEGYKFLWYAEENVILLVNEETNEIEYPKEYEGEAPVDNIRMCFDLALPGAVVVAEPNNGSEESNIGTINFDAKYSFTVSEEKREDYKEWFADYYVKLELPQNVTSVDIPLAGFYEWYSPEWEAMIAFDVTNQELEDIGGYIPLVYTFKNVLLKYEADVQTNIKTFECGILSIDEEFINNNIDLFGGSYESPAGAKMTVELRLTEPDPENLGQPKENGEYVIIGVFEYTFK